MARPSNAPMEKSLMKMSKEWLARLLADELRTTKKLEEENKKMKEGSEDLKMWLREKLPLALLKEYMEKFEWVDLKNV